MSIKNKIAIITGGNNGIGKAITMALAAQGCIVGIFSRNQKRNEDIKKTVSDQNGIIHTYTIDVAKVDQLQNGVEDMVSRYKKIDYLINNAGVVKFGKATSFTPQDFNYMHAVNTRAPYILSKLCIPYMPTTSNATIINISPPLLNPKSALVKDFSQKIGYTTTKYLTSMLTVGLAGEFKDRQIKAFSLWPKYGIFTDSLSMVAGKQSAKFCRNPQIMADACLTLLKNPEKFVSGQGYLDEDILKGIDFSSYAIEKEVGKTGKLMRVPFT